MLKKDASVSSKVHFNKTSTVDEINIHSQKTAVKKSHNVVDVKHASVMDTVASESTNKNVSHASLVKCRRIKRIKKRKQVVSLNRCLPSDNESPTQKHLSVVARPSNDLVSSVIIPAKRKTAKKSKRFRRKSKTKRNILTSCKTAPNELLARSQTSLVLSSEKVLSTPDDLNVHLSFTSKDKRGKSRKRNEGDHTPSHGFKKAYTDWLKQPVLTNVVDDTSSEDDAAVIRLSKLSKTHKTVDAMDVLFDEKRERHHHKLGSKQRSVSMEKVLDGIDAACKQKLSSTDMSTKIDQDGAQIAPKLSKVETQPQNLNKYSPSGNVQPSPSPKRVTTCHPADSALSPSRPSDWPTSRDADDGSDHESAHSPPPPPLIPPPSSHRNPVMHSPSRKRHLPSSSVEQSGGDSLSGGGRNIFTAFNLGVSPSDNVVSSSTSSRSLRVTSDYDYNDDDDDYDACDVTPRWRPAMLATRNASVETQTTPKHLHPTTSSVCEKNLTSRPIETKIKIKTASMTLDVVDKTQKCKTSEGIEYSERRCFRGEGGEVVGKDKIIQPRDASIPVRFTMDRDVVALSLVPPEQRSSLGAEEAVTTSDSAAQGPALASVAVLSRNKTSTTSLVGNQPGTSHTNAINSKPTTVSVSDFINTSSFRRVNDKVAPSTECITNKLVNSNDACFSHCLSERVEIKCVLSVASCPSTFTPATAIPSRLQSPSTTSSSVNCPSASASMSVHSQLHYLHQQLRPTQMPPPTKMHSTQKQQPASLSCEVGEERISVDCRYDGSCIDPVDNYPSGELSAKVNNRVDILSDDAFAARSICLPPSLRTQCSTVQCKTGQQPADQDDNCLVTERFSSNKIEKFTRILTSTCPSVVSDRINDCPTPGDQYYSTDIVDCSENRALTIIPLIISERYNKLMSSALQVGSSELADVISTSPSASDSLTPVGGSMAQSLQQTALFKPYQLGTTTSPCVDRYDTSENQCNSLLVCESTDSKPFIGLNTVETEHILESGLSIAPIHPAFGLRYLALNNDMSGRRQTSYGAASSRDLAVGEINSSEMATASGSMNQEPGERRILGQVIRVPVYTASVTRRSLKSPPRCRTSPVSSKAAAMCTQSGAGGSNRVTELHCLTNKTKKGKTCDKSINLKDRARFVNDKFHNGVTGAVCGSVSNVVVSGAGQPSVEIMTHRGVTNTKQTRTTVSTNVCVPVVSLQHMPGGCERAAFTPDNIIVSENIPEEIPVTVSMLAPIKLSLAIHQNYGRASTHSGGAKTTSWVSTSSIQAPATSPREKRNNKKFELEKIINALPMKKQKLEATSPNYAAGISQKNGKGGDSVSKTTDDSNIKVSETTSTCYAGDDMMTPMTSLSGAQLSRRSGLRSDTSPGRGGGGGPGSSPGRSAGNSPARSSAGSSPAQSSVFSELSAYPAGGGYLVRKKLVIDLERCTTSPLAVRTPTCDDLAPKTKVQCLITPTVPQPPIAKLVVNLHRVPSCGTVSAAVAQSISPSSRTDVGNEEWTHREGQKSSVNNPPTVSPSTSNTDVSCPPTTKRLKLMCNGMTIYRQVLNVIMFLLLIKLFIVLNHNQSFKSRYLIH